MSNSFNDIKTLFEKYICIYTGLIKSEKNYDEQSLRAKIVEIATRNRNFIDDFSKIIIGHLDKDDTKFKCRLFDIIDLLFKEPPTAKEYISKLSGHLFNSFKECFTWSEFEDRVLLFKIFYTWKYLISPDIFKKIRENNKIDDFKEMFTKKYPGKIEKYDEYNEKIRLNLLNSKINNNNISGNNRHEQTSHKDIKININKFSNSNNNNNHKISTNQVNNKKIIIEKKFEEDNIPNNTNNNQPNINLNTKIKSKKEAKMTGKKRKSSHEKSNDGNASTNKKKSMEQMKNIINQSMNNPSFINPNTKININENDFISAQNSLSNNNPLNCIFGGGMNYPNLYIQNPPQMQQQENQQQQQQLIQNILAMMNQQSILQNPNPNQISLREYLIFQFITNTNIKLNTNLRFFSSLAKYYNDSLVESNKIDIKYKYEDIYFNKEYQTIKSKVDSKLFNDIKKNVCAICGFRTLFYNNLTEHLDIHFNVNYLQIEGKNLFRKIGHNRNNWITGDTNSKNAKNKVGHTLGNLLYYKNMMYNNLVKIKNEQEEDNEELMYPVDEEAKEVCYYCGDEFKKVFSTKYHYWFYNKVVQIREDKKKNLVHQSCYDELMKIK